MKRLFFLTLLLNICVNAQFKVKETLEWQKVGNYAQRLTLYKTTNDTKAKFIYLDAVELTDMNEYQFEFAINDSTLDNLYNVMLEGLKEDKTFEKVLEFPEGNLYLIYYKSFGKTYLSLGFDSSEILEDDNSLTKRRESFGLNENRLKKIFNK